VAQERLRGTLLRAVSPPIQTVAITNESLEYKWHPLVGTQINFVNLNRVEVFANHTVFIRGVGNQILSVIRYGTDQDAKLFADLLMGFRERYMQRHVVLQAQVAPPPKALRLQPTIGSGFVINAQGEMLTNAHVVERCKEVWARLDSREKYRAALIVQDTQNDLALLRLPVAPKQWLVFREGHDIRQGDEIIAIGFPLMSYMETSGVTVTTGIVSALMGIQDDSRRLQITAPVQPGNSGGPLLDTSGNIVGIVDSKLDELVAVKRTGGFPQNINFAIKSSVVQNFLNATEIAYDTTASTQKFSTTEISARAKRNVVLIECWQ
jgi:S1-C subfamily serine protease